jgi:hypothetical protein
MTITLHLMMVKLLSKLCDIKSLKSSWYLFAISFDFWVGHIVEVDIIWVSLSKSFCYLH